MSFLKQILKPFVDFDDSQKASGQQGQPGTAKGPVQQGPGKGAQIPGSAGQAVPGQAAGAKPGSGQSATGQPPAAGIDLNSTEPAHHPLVNESPKAIPEPPKQVLAYSPSGTLIGPMPEHEAYFEKLVEDANNKNPLFQGTDYKEFIDSKIDIDDITDEAIRYKTAFNILKSSGLTKDKLLSTGQEYLNVIGRDLNAFQSAHSQQYQKEVRQKELQIDKKVEELQALTIRINTLKQEINQASSEINLTREKLNTTKNSFLLAGENKQREIQTELQKIAHYF